MNQDMKVMPLLIAIPQIACCIAGLCLGGSSTKPGSCLLLASVWMFGMGIGWWARKRSHKPEEAD